jgi:hypothetical protein
VERGRWEGGRRGDGNVGAWQKRGACSGWLVRCLLGARPGGGPSRGSRHLQDGHSSGPLVLAGQRLARRANCHEPRRQRPPGPRPRANATASSPRPETLPLHVPDRAWRRCRDQAPLSVCRPRRPRPRSTPHPSPCPHPAGNPTRSVNGFSPRGAPIARLQTIWDLEAFLGLLPRCRRY